MAVQLATLDILVNEAHFDPSVARAIGAAIEAELRGAEAVTVPMLDVRLENWKNLFELKMNQLEMRIDLKIAQMENRLLLKMAALQAAGIGILFALLRGVL